MDRTKEFFDIVYATEIPQPQHKIVPFYENIKKKYEEILKIIDELNNISLYELFKMGTKLTKGYELIREYRQMLPNEVSGNTDFQICILSLRNIINNNATKANLRLNEIKRKYNEKNAVELTSETAKNASSNSLYNNNESSQLIIEEEKQKTHYEHYEFSQERRRIVKSISEIGEIVEDISIHVSLQEEQLNRIDMALAETEKWSKRAINELNETWLVVKSDRKFMYKFFIFWFFIFFIFFICKKI